MQIDDYQFATNAITKFHSALLVEGWFFHPSDKLSRVTLRESDQRPHQISAVAIPSAIDLGSDLGFRLQALRSQSNSPLDAVLEFITVARRRLSCPLRDLAMDRGAGRPTADLTSEFRRLVRELAPRPLVLDVGGRPRSGKEYRDEFPEADVKTVDIVADAGVDVVADAHELSTHFGRCSVDAIFSVSTFEHLIMPWKVAVEMNKVLKLGGIAFVHTHQTLGLHDIPWDFFRFSDASWDGLFNRRTGFEILDRQMDREHFVLPFIFHPEKLDAERSNGFEGSAVLVRKVSETELEWPVRIAEIVGTQYTDG